MSIKNTFRSLVTASCILLCTSPVFAGNSFTASGDASEDMAEAAIHLASATGHLSCASMYLSADTAITLGRPVAHTVVKGAELSGDVISFAGDVLQEGLVSTARLSADLTMAGVKFSADTTAFVAGAALAGIYISAETADYFLGQAVNIAAASGRLSGEAAELALTLSAAGVEMSADSAILVANAGKKGIAISEEAAETFIDNSLKIAADCIEAAHITERYVIMTTVEANRLLREASLKTVRTTIEGGKRVYSFSAQTAAHLHSLGIDSVKLAKELSSKAINTTTTTIHRSIRGANDAIVIVINTGSGLIVTSIDSVTENIEAATAAIK